MITYHQLQTFLAVARTGSLTKAAREMSATQPTVSLQLGLLRKFLGTSLFERPGGKFQLTPAGESLRRYAEEAVGGLRMLQQEVAAQTGIFAGPLSVGAPFVTSRHVLPAVLSRFLQQFPGVDLQLHVEFPEQLFAGLLANRLDVACYIGVPTPAGLTVGPLVEDELVLIASPQHALAGRRLVTPQRLSEQSFVAVGSTLFRRMVEAKLRGAGVTTRPTAEARHQEAGKRLVERNLGYSVAMRSCAREEIEDGRLVALKLDAPPMHAEVVAAFRSRPVTPPLVREFVRFVRADLTTHLHAAPPARQRRKGSARAHTRAKRG